MKRITTLLLLFSISFLAKAQPANDECSTLINLGVAPICPIVDTFTNFNATASLISNDPNINIPSCFNGGAPDGDVWFSFDIPADGSFVDVQIELNAVDGPNGGIVQPQMAIYRGGCGLDGLAELACVTAPAGGTSLETILLGLTPGLTYFLRIEDWSATATPNWGDFELCIKEPDVEFNMGDVASTTLCSGTLFDSGGIDGEYSNGENNTFTICPSDPHSCINIDVVNYNIESGFDDLTFYAGEDTNAPIFVAFDGSGGGTQFGIESTCVTIGFSSDGSVTFDGFELTWECTTAACDNSFITCANPEVIPSLPYDMDGLTTCGSFDSQSFGACPFSFDLLGGEDYIFTYTSAGDECIEVIASGVGLGTGVSIYDQCPESSLQCYGAAINTENDTAMISAAYLDAPGTYFIVIDNPDCTDFDLFVNTTECPEILPAANVCSNSISINGCIDPAGIPSLINIDQEETPEPECMVDGVNDGAWGGIGQGHFTWFNFQAQADGNFGFLANNGDVLEGSDIDINVWGPVTNVEDLCDFVKNNQPLRSTWAAPNPAPFDLTGLTDLNPYDGSTINDEYENAGGDGFVTTMPVDSGSWYIVLINDFSGSIVNGGIQMDFGPSSEGILDPATGAFSISQDMTACPDVPFALEASGGSLYEWITTDGLSCTDCPNPTATISGPTTFEVAITSACATDTLSVDVAFMEIDAGANESVCIGESIQLGAQSNFDDVTYSWNIPSGTVDCSDCPNPILNTEGLPAADYDYEVTISNAFCSTSDIVTVTVLDIPIPVYTIADEIILCEGESIDLGGPTTAGVSYSWTSSISGFSSDQSNPNITPTENGIYYLEVSNMECPNAVFDSVAIGVAEIPFIQPQPDTIICAGEDITILNIITASDIEYSWSPMGGVANPVLANNIFTPTETTTYVLTAARGDCQTLEEFTIQVDQPAEIMIDGVTTVCEGMGTTLTANANATGTYEWSTAEMENTISTGDLDVTTSFSVTFNNDNSCPPITENVVVNVVPGIEIIGEIICTPADTIFEGDQVTLSIETSITGVSYSWSTNETTSTITTSPMYNGGNGESYSVIVTDANGCTAEAFKTVPVQQSIFDMPNVFTPDGDNVNDTFGPVIIGPNYEVLDFRIYNRWGQKVHEASGSNYKWDGNIDGQAAASDVYAFILVFERPDGTRDQLAGDVTLVR